MRHTIAFIAALMTSLTMAAQTLRVTVGQVTYLFPSAQTGDMTFAQGTSLTIMGKTFQASDISQMTVEDTTVTPNEVAVSYNGSTATVTVAGNVAQYVEPVVSGAHVNIGQTNTADVDGDEISYVLSGSTTDGEFAMTGTYKCTVELNGLTLTNPSGAAINIQDGKRIKISVKKGTENTLTDCASGSQKACLVVKGHAEFKGQGTLNINALTKHGIKTGEYMSVKNCTINVLKAAGDGIHANEYFLMESGTISLTSLGDDGIQAELDGTSSTGQTTDHDGEDSGNIYITGGSISASITAQAAKGIKADGDLYVSGGTVDVTTSGSGTYDSTDRDAKGCAGLKSDGNMTLSGGTLTLKNTGSGGKCIKCDGALTISDAVVITATNSGSQYRYSSYYTASAKAIKADGALTISGGTVNATASTHEAIESKSTIDITGGTIYAQSSDDAINAASHFTISGGTVMGYSTGNDGLDANGNMYIKGGVVYAIGSTQPEVALDANTEGGYKLYIQGGTIITLGPLESGAQLSQTCYQASSYSKNTWYAVTVGSQTIAFKTPSTSQGSGLVVSGSSTPTVLSGVTPTGTSLWNGYGYVPATVSGGSSVTLSTYSGNSQGGPGGGHGGGGGGGGRWW